MSAFTRVSSHLLTPDYRIREAKSNRGRPSRLGGTPARTPLQQPQPQTNFGSSGNLFGNVQQPQQSSFEVPNGGNSFNFSFGGAANTNNPFASVPAPTNTFTGFGVTQQAQQNSEEDMMQESPKKQRASEGFASSTNGQPQSGGLFQFGQSQSNSFGGFGQQPALQADKPSQSFSFGAGKTQQSNGSTPIFGGFNANPASTAQIAAEAPKPIFSFGETIANTPASSQAPAEAPKPLFQFGQTATNTPASTQAPLFSNPAATMTAPPEPTTLFATSAPASSSFNFAGTSSNPFSQISKADTTNLFANPAKTSTNAQSTTPAPAINPFAGLFGQQSSTVTPGAATKTAPSTSTAFKFGSIGQPAVEKPEEKAAESAAEPRPASTPFKFGASTAGAVTPAFGGFGNTTAATNTGSRFGQSSQDTQQSSVAGNQEAPQSNPSTNHFGANPDTPNASANINIFGSAFKPAVPSPMSTSTSSLFGTGAYIVEAPKDNGSKELLPSTSNSEQQNSAPKPSLFSSASTSAQSSNTVKESSMNVFGQSSKPIFGAPTANERPTSPPKPSSSTASAASQLLKQSEPVNKTAEQPAENLFAQSSPARSSGVSTLSSVFIPVNPAASSASATSATQSTAASKQLDDESNTKNLRMKTAGPDAIPRSLDNDTRSDYDKIHRLEALNKSFKEQVASIDVTKYDLDEMIRAYCDMRESIGAPTGMYVRAKAGSKRSPEEPHHVEELDRSAKRARTSQSTLQQAISSEPAAEIPKVPPPTPAIASVPDKVSETASAPSCPSSNVDASRTSQLFTSMLDDASAIPKPGSSQALFGSRTPTATDVSKQIPSTAPPAAAKSMFTFGAPNAATADDEETSKFLPSTTPTKSPPKKQLVEAPKPPSFGPPKFAATSGTNFMSAFGAQAAANKEKLDKAEKAKRKAEDFDSDEDDEAEFDRKYEEEQRAKRSKITEAVSGPILGGFKPSVTGPSRTPSPFDAFLAKAQPPKSESMFVEQDKSATDDETEQEVSGSSESTEGHDDEEEEAEEGEEAGDAGDEEEEEVEEDHEEAEAVDEGAAASFFGRITRNPNLNTDGTKKGANGGLKDTSSTPWVSNTPAVTTPSDPFSHVAATPGIFNHDRFKTPKAPTFSPFTPINGDSEQEESASEAAPTTNGIFGSTTPTVSPRKSSDDDDQKKPNPFAAIPKGTPFKGFTSTPPYFDFQTSSMLLSSAASTPGKPAPATSNNPFGSLSNGTNAESPQNHTWEKGTPIKFASSTTANKENTAPPSFNFTEATPEGTPEKQTAPTGPKPFQSLFGTGGVKAAATSGGLGFGFGSAAGSSLTPSIFSSVASSRATSPGLTDTESVGTDTDEPPPSDPQSDLTSSRAGEEHEETLYEVRTKALRFVSELEMGRGESNKRDWLTQGVGHLRILKNKDTGKTRMVLRGEPAGNIVINANLEKQIEYKAPSRTDGVGKGGMLKFAIPITDEVQSWVLKVKTEQIAQDLAEVMEAHK